MLKIRNITSLDIKTIVEIHVEVFSNFFLTSLGKSFLYTYYKSSLKSPECIAVCAINEANDVIGFAVGTNYSKGYHKKLIINNMMPFIKQLLIIIFKNPKAILRLLNNISKVQTLNDDGHYAELLSIAVLPYYKGHGIGKLLIDEFENVAVKRNCIKVALTTDFFNNDLVVNFYKAKGYEIFHEFIAYPDRKMYKMIKNIK